MDHLWEKNSLKDSSFQNKFLPSIGDFVWWKHWPVESFSVSSTGWGTSQTLRSGFGIPNFNSPSFTDCLFQMHSQCDHQVVTEWLSRSSFMDITIKSSELFQCWKVNYCLVNPGEDSVHSRQRTPGSEHLPQAALWKLQVTREENKGSVDGTPDSWKGKGQMWGWRWEQKLAGEDTWYGDKAWLISHDSNWKVAKPTWLLIPPNLHQGSPVHKVSLFPCLVTSWWRPGLWEWFSSPALVSLESISSLHPSARPSFCPAGMSTVPSHPCSSAPIVLTSCHPPLYSTFGQSHPLPTHLLIRSLWSM